MNDTIKSLYERKSVRIFTEEKIEQEKIDIILNSSMQAPTAGNQMLYSIIQVKDIELLEKLAVTCDNQQFIAKSPLVLIYLADLRRWYDSFSYAVCNPKKPELGNLLLACQDATIAAQNAVVAAEALGLGSCYIGDILENYETVTELLNLDEFTLPISMLVIGYPTKKQKERIKPSRFAKKYIVFENTYRRLSEQEHLEMFKQYVDNKEEFTNYLKKFHDRKYASDFAKEMNRSSKKYVENFMDV